MAREGGPRAFADDASRALRDPLTICLGYLDRLPEDDPDERHRAIEIVVHELHRMTKLIDDLEILATADQPDFLRRETIDLGAFTGELVQKARTLGRRAWSIERVGHGPIVADPDRLTVAVLDLADNAVQNTIVGQSIALGSSLSGDEARLWVRDVGHGVPDSDEPRIFERFTRGEDAHRRYRGGGLGLAVVKAIAEAHGGHVEMEKPPGEGSMFTIVLPRSPIDKATGTNDRG